MASGIYEELFRNLRSSRDALADSYQWFTHDTPYDRLAKIRRDGLVPHLVSNCPPEVVDRFGECGRKIVYLHPIGAELRPQSSQCPPFFRLGLSGSDLPERVGLDWSYDWTLARIIRDDFHDRSCYDIIREVARRRGSIAAYDRIPASKLRVWKVGLPDDPAHWPQLADVKDTKIKKLWQP
jgi:hypothetical protein